MNGIKLKKRIVKRSSGMLDNKEISPMLTVEQAGRLLNVHPNTIRRWADTGVLKVYRINHRGDRRFKKDDVISTLESQE